MFTLPIKSDLKKRQAKYKEFKIKFNEVMKNKKLSKYHEMREAVVNNAVSNANTSNLSNFDSEQVSKHRETKINEYR